MGKRLMPGKTVHSKGKKMSHWRPPAPPEVVWDKVKHKWIWLKNVNKIEEKSI